MAEGLTPGLTVTRKLVVDRGRTVAFMGEECRVYGTPFLIQDIEGTCRNLILEHLEEGQDSVGTNVTLDHVAPTMEGTEIEILVTVDDIDRRAVTFKVTARDSVDELAKGKHSRFIVDKEKVAERLAAKALKLAKAQEV